jgi:hypothetical protein
MKHNIEFNIDFLICIIILIIIFFVYLFFQKNNNQEYNTNIINEKYRVNPISNQNKEEIKRFFLSLGLKYCPHIIFDDKDENIANNKKINEKNKKINKKYAKFLSYENKKTKLPKLYIKFISDDLGFGLFADQNFKKDDYVGEFCGTITSNPDPSSDNYNYSYLDDTDIVIAPRKIGNELQFANHSKNANVDWKHIVGIDNKEHVIFVAVNAIKKGEQILIDYGDDYWKSSERKKINL